MELIDAAGIENGGQDIDDVPDEPDLANKCRALLPSGLRCTGRRHGRRILCANCIEWQSEAGEDRAKVANQNENPCMVSTTGSLRATYMDLGRLMQNIFPAICQVEPYYDDQYVVKEVDENDEVIDEDDGGFIICGTHLGVPAVIPRGGKADPGLLSSGVGGSSSGSSHSHSHSSNGGSSRLHVGNRAAILNTHNTIKIRGMRVVVVEVHATAEQQITRLERWCTEFGEKWLDGIGDCRVTQYVHTIASHAANHMRVHVSLGKFSNSVIENFHKLVRFHYQHTAREGGLDAKEATYAVMQRMLAVRMLEIEKREGGKAILCKLRHRRGDCACTLGRPCSWE
jgi:hypothetical protein